MLLWGAWADSSPARIEIARLSLLVSTNGSANTFKRIQQRKHLRYFIITISSGSIASYLHESCNIISLRAVSSLIPWSVCGIKFVAYNGFPLDI